MLEKQMWMKYASDLLVELQQMLDEGRDVECFREDCEKIVELSKTKNCEAEAEALLKQMHIRPVRKDYHYFEPSSLDMIKEAAAGAKTTNWEEELSVGSLRDKIAGAWIGRISGCLLGKPVECLRSEAIKRVLDSTGNQPLSRYMDSREFPEGLAEELDQYPYALWKKCWIDRIQNEKLVSAPMDDDTNYTVFTMKLIEEYGEDFTSNDVLEAWLYWIPMFATCTAERVAYRNAANGMYAPQTAFYKNPYREWIGAQIRGDFFGYLNPGNPQRAAEMAFRDASISHVKNGIYGEMFVAAMIAEAAVSDDVVQVIETGLQVIPKTSRLMEEIQLVLEWYRKAMTAEEVIGEIHKKYDEYVQHDWCHTNSNAMIVVAALLYGEHDLGKTICIAVQAAFDTDCNGATAGSVIGMVLGEGAIANYWSDAFERRLKTSIDGYHQVDIDLLTDKTLELILRKRNDKA